MGKKVKKGKLKKYKGDWYYVKDKLYKVKFIEQIPKGDWVYPYWFMKLFVRGYTDGEVIYIKKGTKIGLDRLILHEIGHLLGKKHSWKPNLMFPSWLGRWFMRW